MKYSKYVMWGLLVAVLCIGGYWCWRAFMPESYLRVLPPRLKALAVVNMPALSEETGMAAEDMAHLLPEGWASAVAGIDWSQKVYAFVSAREYVGVLVAVDDVDKLADFFRQGERRGFCTAPEERFGCRWTVVDGKWLAGFDNKALLVMGPGLAANMDVLRQEMAGYFRQEGQNSGMSSSLFEAVNRSVAAFSFVSQLDLLPAFYDDALKMSLPEHANLSDVSVLAEVHLMKQGLKVTAEYLSGNPEINKYYEQLFRPERKLTGQYARYVPEDVLAWACADVEGEELLERLRRNPAVRTFLLGLNMGVDADLMIRSIRGEVAFTLNSFAHGGQDFLLTARVENTDFLKEAGYWEKSAASAGIFTFRNLGDNRFFISSGDLQAYFGVEGETLYVTPDERLAQAVCSDETTVLSRWADTVRNSHFFLWLDLEKLWRQPSVAMLLRGMGQDGAVQKLDLLDELVLYLPDARRIALELRVREGRNVLEELLK